VPFEVDNVYHTWSDGFTWLGPYTVSKDKTLALSTEMDLLTSPWRNDWSVVVYSSVSQI
jgi:hypothetical protein